MNGHPPNDSFDETKDRNWLIEQCKSKKGYCTKLIEYDGWEIKDDYPVR